MISQDPEVNFGYSISPDRQINFNQTNKTILELIRKLEKTIDLCIFCGSCSATCSAALHSDFNLRRINLLVKRGMIAGLKEEVKKCMLCGKCSLACPRDINTRNLVLSLRKVLDNYDINEL
jgi:heterodisulfide reductase subunit C